ncbi:MAG: c-type cytochrome, partial [Salinarimonas sp.]
MRNLTFAAATAALLALPSLALPNLAAAQEATGDPEAGKRVFTQCQSCHMVGENARTRVGRVLNDVFGREAGSVEDYRYSEAMQ